MYNAEFWSLFSKWHPHRSGPSRDILTYGRVNKIAASVGAVLITSGFVSLITGIAQSEGLAQAVTNFEHFNPGSFMAASHTSEVPQQPDHGESPSRDLMLGGFALIAEGGAIAGIGVVRSRTYAKMRLLMSEDIMKVKDNVIAPEMYQLTQEYYGHLDVPTYVRKEELPPT